MSYLADTAIKGRPLAASGNLGQLVYIAPDSDNPEAVINVRLSNGTGFYTAGGTTISGGAALSADQGSPGLLSSAWPVKLSNGSAMIGVEATPLWITGTLGLAQVAGSITALSGSVVGLLAGGSPSSIENPVPVLQMEPLIQWQYDITDARIYAGWAYRGLPTGSAVWTIKRTRFSAGNPTDTTWALTSSWDSRDIALYS